MAKEAEIWRKCYELAMIETDETDCLFAKDLLNCMADNIDKEIHPKRAKAIFVDCYKLLESQLEKTNWIAVNENIDKLVQGKYSQDEAEQRLCVELIAVVVNQLGRKNGNGANTV